MTINTADIIVVLIIGLGVTLGAFKGVIKMVLSLCSTLMAIIVAFFIQPLILPILVANTNLFTRLTEIISQNINLTDLAQKIHQPAGAPLEMNAGLNPQIINLLTRKIGSGMDLDSMQMEISRHLAWIALQIISFFIGFVVIVLIFVVIGWILSGVGKLPVIREVNKAAGAALGGLIGVLLIWIGMLFLNYWFSTGQQMEIYAMLQNSLLAKYLYQYNFLLYYMILLQ